MPFEWCFPLWTIHFGGTSIYGKPQILLEDRAAPTWCSKFGTQPIDPIVDYVRTSKSPSCQVENSVARHSYESRRISVISDQRGFTVWRLSIKLMYNWFWRRTVSLILLLLCPAGTLLGGLLSVKMVHRPRIMVVCVSLLIFHVFTISRYVIYVSLCLSG